MIDLLVKELDKEMQEAEVSDGGRSGDGHRPPESPARVSEDVPMRWHDNRRLRTRPGHTAPGRPPREPVRLSAVFQHLQGRRDNEARFLIAKGVHAARGVQRQKAL